MTRDDVKRQHRARQLRTAERLIEAWMPFGRDRDSILMRLGRAATVLETHDYKVCVSCGEEFHFNPRRFVEPPARCLRCGRAPRVNERAARDLCLLTEEEARRLIAQGRIEELAGRFVEHMQAADAMGRLPELLAGLTEAERNRLVDILFAAVAGSGVH